MVEGHETDAKAGIASPSQTTIVANSFFIYLKHASTTIADEPLANTAAQPVPIASLQVGELQVIASENSAPEGRSKTLAGEGTAVGTVVPV